MHEETLKHTFLSGIKSSDMQAAKKAALAQSSQWLLEEVITYIQQCYLQDKSLASVPKEN